MAPAGVRNSGPRWSLKQRTEQTGINEHPSYPKVARGWRKLEIDPLACRRSHNLEAHAPRALLRVGHMQREEVAEESHRRSDAHHGFAHEGKDGKKSHRLRVKMQH